MIKRIFLIQNSKIKIFQGHGIPRIVDTGSKLFKVIWLICFFGSLGMCIYMVYRCINQYLQYGVNTVQEFVEDSTFEFPMISFCNVNTFASRSAYRYLRDYYNERYNVNITNYEELSLLIKNGTVQYDTDWLLYRTYDPSLNESFRKSLDVTPYQMISYCTFNEKPCNSSDFLWYYHPLYGRLYSNFNVFLITLLLFSILGNFLSK
jgi:hypothetical protein